MPDLSGTEGSTFAWEGKLVREIQGGGGRRTGGVLKGNGYEKKGQKVGFLMEYSGRRSAQEKSQRKGRFHLRTLLEKQSGGLEEG